MKVIVPRLIVMFLLSLAPVVCHSQEFSADVVYVTGGMTKAASTASTSSTRPSSKLFVSKDKLRLETRGLTSTILLVNGTSRTFLALFPAKKAYQPLASGPSEYFRVENADDACADWQKATDQKIACEKVAQEEVNGRQTIKYTNKVASETAPSAVWIDVALKFVVKWQGSEGGAELRNIAEAPQTADLFAVPSDYKTLQPSKRSNKGFPQR